MVVSATCPKFVPGSSAARPRVRGLGGFFGLSLILVIYVGACTSTRSADTPHERVRTVAAPGLVAAPPPSGAIGTPSGLASAGSSGPVPSASAPPSPPPPVQPALARGTGTPSDKALAQGDEAYDADELAGARKAYQTAARLAPKDPAPLVGLARVAIAQSGIPTDHAAAPNHPVLKREVRSLKKALKLSSDYAPAHVELGRALLMLGKAEDALAALRKAVSLVPGDPEAHSALGVAFLATGKGKEALQEIQRAAELDAGNVARQTNLGTVLLLRGRTHDAVRVFERAVAMAPNDARVRTDLGTAYLALHEVDRGLPHLRRAVALDDSRATFRSNLGYALQLKGSHADAIAQYRKAIALDSRLGSAWINLGTALAQTGKRAEAKKAFKRALAIDPGDPRAKANLEELKEIEAADGGK